MSVSSSTESAVGRVIRVASWNIHEAVPVKPAADPVKELAERLDGVDLAALQEVSLTPDGEFSEFRLLRNVTALREHGTFPMSDSAMSPDRRMGVVILSRWPITEVHRIPLPNPELKIRKGSNWIFSHDKGIMAARIGAPNQEFWLATVHMFPFYLFDSDPRESRFSDIWRNFAESIDALDDLPLLLAGDFNTEHRELLTGKLSCRVQRGVIGTPTYRGIESDDILSTSEFRLRGTRVLPTFSDHDLCVCEYELTQR